MRQDPSITDREKIELLLHMFAPRITNLREVLRRLLESKNPYFREASDYWLSALGGLVQVAQRPDDPPPGQLDLVTKLLHLGGQAWLRGVEQEAKAAQRRGPVSLHLGAAMHRRNELDELASAARGIRESLDQLAAAAS